MSVRNFIFGNEFAIQFPKFVGREKLKEYSYKIKVDRLGLEDFVTIYDILVPKTTVWSPQAASALVRSILVDQESKNVTVFFDIFTSASRIHFRVSIQEADVYYLQTLVSAFYPEAEVRESERQPIDYPFYRQTLLLERRSNVNFQRGILAEQIQSHDPLQTLLVSMNGLLPEENLQFSIYKYAAITLNEKQINEALTQSWAEAGLQTQVNPQGNSLADSFAAGLIGGWLDNKKRTARFSASEEQWYRAKLRQPLYKITIGLRFDTPDPARQQLFKAIVSLLYELPNVDRGTASRAVKITNDDEWNATHPILEFERLRDDWLGEKNQKKRIEKWERVEAKTFNLIPEEIAALWHLPHTRLSVPNIVWLSSVPAQVVSNGMFDANRVRIGSADEMTTKIALSRPDTRYHRYITGQTGMGKSTLLHHLITEDIQAGCGVAVLDPHGTLIRDILECSIPPERAEDVVLLELGDGRRPVPLNPFRTPAGVDAQQRFDTVFWIFKSLYAGNWSETRMETTIRNILQVLSADPEATPLDFQEIILNDTYRRKIVERAVQQGNISRASRNWWNNFNGLSPSEQRSQTQSVLSRLNAFLGSAQVEKMTCHPKLLNFRQFITQKKIVLVNLKGDAIKSEVGSLGAILLAQFYLASLALGDIPGDAPPRYYMYVDEAQRFITTSLPAMFSEARKFGLALTLSNQYLGQLDDETREGILKNVGTKVSFECHPDEARLTGKMYEPDIEAAILTSLGRGRAVVKTRSSGETLQAFVVKVTPPLQPTGELLRPTQPPFPTAQEVDDWLNKRYEGDLFKKPPAEDKLSDFEPPADEPPLTEQTIAPLSFLSDFEPPAQAQSSLNQTVTPPLNDFEPPVNVDDTKPRQAVNEPVTQEQIHLGKVTPPISLSDDDLLTKLFEEFDDGDA